MACSAVHERDAVAGDRLALGDVRQRDLVALRHLVDQRQRERRAVDLRDRGAGRQPLVVGDDGDVVLRVHAQQQRRGEFGGHDGRRLRRRRGR
jgi:hypothetical protein